VVIGSEADGSRDLAFVGISLRAPGQARAPHFVASSGTTRTDPIRKSID